MAVDRRDCVASEEKPRRRRVREPARIGPTPNPSRAAPSTMSPRAIPLQVRAIIPRRPARPAASSSSSSSRRPRSLLRTLPSSDAASASDPFALESTRGCHTDGCCTNDLVASLEARAGNPGAVEDVNLRECGDGDVVAALATRAGEIATGSLAAHILWHVSSTPRMRHLREAGHLLDAVCARRGPFRALHALYNDSVVPLAWMRGGEDAREEVDGPTPPTTPTPDVRSEGGRAEKKGAVTATDDAAVEHDDDAAVEHLRLRDANKAAARDALTSTPPNPRAAARADGHLRRDTAGGDTAGGKINEPPPRMPAFGWHMPYDYLPRHLAYILRALVELPAPAPDDANAQASAPLSRPKPMSSDAAG